MTQVERVFDIFAKKRYKVVHFTIGCSEDSLQEWNALHHQPGSNLYIVALIWFGKLPYSVHTIAEINVEPLCFIVNVAKYYFFCP